jgi:hypothetical protein
MQGASRNVATGNRRRRAPRSGLTAAAAAGLLASGLVLQAVPASATPLPSGAVTYTSGTGANLLCPAGTYVVPAGTRYVQVVAIGGAGTGGGTYSANSTGGPGGNGAQVTTVLPVSAGQSLTVVAGRPGSNGTTDSNSGWPDGGVNSFNLGQGGGSSYVTTQPLFPRSGCKDGTNDGLTPPTVLHLDRSQMLVLAGGGGGGGGSSLFGSGGSGGNAGANADLSGQGGATAYHLDSDCGQGGGAGGGSATGPGTYGPSGCSGLNGTVGNGFYGGDASETATTGTSAGGAGGGGWYGGGSGGSGTGLGGGGGGAGSSYVSPTARTTSIAQASPVGGPSVTITPLATPTTTAVTAGSPLVNWYTAVPKVTLTADAAGGAAVDKTYYAIDNPICGDATRGSCQLYTGPFDVAAGLHTLTYFTVNALNLDEPLQTRSFAVTPTSASAAGVTASSLGSGTNPTASASGPAGAPGTVSVSGTGTGAVGAAVYGANPAGAPVFTSSGAYVDVLVSGSGLSGATITDCNLNGGTTVSWWNGSAWAVASNQTYDPSTRCVTVTVNGTTAPSVNQLTGTVIAAGRPPTTTAVATTADGKPYIAGTWTNQSVTVAFTCSPNATASAPVTLGGDRANQSAAGTCTDGVGQKTTTTFTGVDVDKMAPTCSTTVDPSVLWPANSKAVAIRGTVTAGDALSGVARVVGGAVTSNEALAAGDVQGLAVNSPYATPLQLNAVVPDLGQLKATRNGSGNGRTYTQAFTVTDQAGNTNATRCTWTVTVPHDQGSGR